MLRAVCFQSADAASVQVLTLPVFVVIIFLLCGISVFQMLQIMVSLYNIPPRTVKLVLCESVIPCINIIPDFLIPMDTDILFVAYNIPKLRMLQMFPLSGQFLFCISLLFLIRDLCMRIPEKQSQYFCRKTLTYRPEKWYNIKYRLADANIRLA